MLGTDSTRIEYIHKYRTADGVYKLGITSGQGFKRSDS